MQNELFIFHRCYYPASITREEIKEAERAASTMVSKAIKDSLNTVDYMSMDILDIDYDYTEGDCVVDTTFEYETVFNISKDELEDLLANLTEEDSSISGSYKNTYELIIFEVNNEYGNLEENKSKKLNEALFNVHDLKDRADEINASRESVIRSFDFDEARQIVHRLMCSVGEKINRTQRGYVGSSSKILQVVTDKFKKPFERIANEYMQSFLLDDSLINKCIRLIDEIADKVVPILFDQRMVECRRFRENSTTFDQPYMLDVFAGSLQHAPVYKKSTTVLAFHKPMKGGEVIETITSDGLETTNTAEPGDILVKNDMASGEEYLLKPDVFEKRYTLSDIKVKSPYWIMYDAVGKCRAIEYSGKWVEMFGKEMYFTAPWGEKMILKEGDMLATPNADGDIKEVYRIARKEFEDTYKIDGDKRMKESTVKESLPYEEWEYETALEDKKGKFACTLKLSTGAWTTDDEALAKGMLDFDGSENRICKKYKDPILVEIVWNEKEERFQVKFINDYYQSKLLTGIKINATEADRFTLTRYGIDMDKIFDNLAKTILSSEPAKYIQKEYNSSYGDMELFKGTKKHKGQLDLFESTGRHSILEKKDEKKYGDTDLDLASDIYDAGNFRSSFKAEPSFSREVYLDALENDIRPNIMHKDVTRNQAAKWFKQREEEIEEEAKEIVGDNYDSKSHPLSQKLRFYRRCAYMIKGRTETEEKRLQKMRLDSHNLSESLKPTTWSLTNWISKLPLPYKDCETFEDYLDMYGAIVDVYSAKKNHPSPKSSYTYNARNLRFSLKGPLKGYTFDKGDLGKDVIEDLKELLTYPKVDFVSDDFKYIDERVDPWTGESLNESRLKETAMLKLRDDEEVIIDYVSNRYDDDCGSLIVIYFLSGASVDQYKAIKIVDGEKVGQQTVLFRNIDDLLPWIKENTDEDTHILNATNYGYFLFPEYWRETAEEAIPLDELDIYSDDIEWSSHWEKEPLKEQWQQDIGYSVESHAESLLWKVVESDPDFDHFINREFPGDEYSWNECQNLSLEFIVEAIEYGYGEGDEEDIRHILNKLKPIWGYKAPVMAENKLIEKENLKKNIEATIMAVFEEENMKLLGSKAGEKTLFDYLSYLFGSLDKSDRIFLRSSHEYEDLLVEDLNGIKLDFSKNSYFWKDDAVEASFWIKEPDLIEGKTEAVLNLFYKKDGNLYNVSRGTIDCDTGLLTLFLQQYKQNKDGKFIFDSSTNGKYEKLTYDDLFTQEELDFLKKKYTKFKENHHVGDRAVNEQIIHAADKEDINDGLRILLSVTAAEAEHIATSYKMYSGGFQTLRSTVSKYYEDDFRALLSDYKDGQFDEWDEFFHTAQDLVQEAATFVADVVRNTPKMQTQPSYKDLTEGKVKEGIFDRFGKNKEAKQAEHRELVSHEYEEYLHDSILQYKESGDEKAILSAIEFIVFESINRFSVDKLANGDYEAHQTFSNAKAARFMLSNDELLLQLIDECNCDEPTEEALCECVEKILDMVFDYGQPYKKDIS